MNLGFILADYDHHQYGCAHVSIMASFLGENNDNSSDSDAGFNINKDYAKKYDSWRQAEELQKREYTDLRL